MKHIILTAAIWFVPALALAHSPLEVTRPANGAVVNEAPGELVFSFRNDFRLTRVSWSRDEEGSRKLPLDGIDGFAREFVVPFKGDGDGVYEIEWRGLGNDGHPQKGRVTFTVQ